MTEQHFKDLKSARAAAERQARQFRLNHVVRRTSQGFTVGFPHYNDSREQIACYVYFSDLQA